MPARLHHRHHRQHLHRRRILREINFRGSRANALTQTRVFFPSFVVVTRVIAVVKLIIMSDFYKLLGVTRGETLEEDALKKAYKKAAMKW